MPVFICNILKGDLYIDASITELFSICLVVRQILEEGKLVQISLLVCDGEMGELFSLVASEDCLEVCSVRLAVGGSYV